MPTNERAYDPEERIAFLTSSPPRTLSYFMLYGTAIAVMLTQMVCLVIDFYESMTMILLAATFPIDFSVWLLVNSIVGMTLGLAILIGLCGAGETRCVSYFFVVWNIYLPGWTALGWWTMAASYQTLSSVLTYLWCRMVLQTVVCVGSLGYLIRHLYGKPL